MPKLSAARSAALSAFLSFVFPGLGQAHAGSRRRGLLVALPIAAFLTFVGARFAVAWQQDQWDVLGTLLQPEVLGAIAAINVLLLGYRVVSIVDAYRLARRASRANGGTTGRVRSASSLALLGLMLAVAAGMHGGAVVLATESRAAVEDVLSGADPLHGNAETDPIFSDALQSAALKGSTGPLAAQLAKFAPVYSSADLSATAAGAVTPDTHDWRANGRLDVLVIGCDHGPGRSSCRTDLMMLVSIRISDGKTAFFGIPRNKTYTPMPAGYPSNDRTKCSACFTDLLANFWRWADERPTLYESGTGGVFGTRGYRALSRVIGNLTGAHIDGYVSTNLNGFAQFMAGIGGLDINIPYKVVDTAYPKEDGSGYTTVVFNPGTQHLDGYRTLRYGRLRQQDSDYCRMQRQQRIFVALRRDQSVNTILNDWSKYTTLGSKYLRTNMSSTQVKEMVRLIGRVNADRITRVTFQPRNGFPERIDSAQVTKIRSRVANAFTTSSNWAYTC